jgi:hypothetical protein
MTGGIHGLRQVVRAYVEIILRKRGYLQPIKKPKKIGKRAKPWTDDENDTALSMRMRGYSDQQIAKAVGRSVSAVTNRIGFRQKCHGKEAA